MPRRLTSRPEDSTVETMAMVMLDTLEQYIVSANSASIDSEYLELTDADEAKLKRALKSALRASVKERQREW